MRVENALRLARGAGRVAHRGRGALVRIGRIRDRLDTVQQLFVVDHRVQAGGSAPAASLNAHHDRVRHPRLRRDLLPQRQQRLVDEHDAIVRVVDDEAELVGMEAKVERVKDAAGQWDAEVGLEMLIVVPCERGNPVAGTDPELLQRPRQTPGPRGEVGEGVPVKRPVRAARDDGPPREDALGVPKDGRQRQREIHHQAVHGADCRCKRPRRQEGDFFAVKPGFDQSLRHDNAISRQTRLSQSTIEPLSHWPSAISHAEMGVLT